MHCWSNVRPERNLAHTLAHWLTCLALLVLLPVGMASAADISLRQPVLTASDDGYSVSADFNINFNSRLEEAVGRGVVLYFTVDFELVHARWYWFNERIVRRSRTYELSYHALTQQYRVSTGGLHQSYNTLDEALRMISRLRNWPVIGKDELRNGVSATAALRMRLDLTQMPKTFQVSAISNKDWNLSSEWVRWPLVPNDASAPAPSAPAENGGETR